MTADQALKIIDLLEAIEKRVENLENEVISIKNERGN